MAKLVTALGVAMLLIGVGFALAPDRLFDAVPWASRTGQLLAVGIRVVFGGVLIVAAPATRYPKGLRIVGVVVLVAGLGLLLLPLSQWERLLSWGLVDQVAVARVAGGIGGLAFGAFLIHAARLRRPASST